MVTSLNKKATLVFLRGILFVCQPSKVKSEVFEIEFAAIRGCNHHILRHRRICRRWLVGKTPVSQPIEKILQNVWLKICVIIFDVCFAWKTNEHCLTLTEKSILYRASHYLRIVVISALKNEKAAFKIQVLIHLLQL